MKSFNESPDLFDDGLEWISASCERRVRIIEGACVEGVRTIPAGCAGPGPEGAQATVGLTAEQAGPDPEASRREAFAEGRREGVRAGYEEGLRQAYDEMRASLATMEAIRKSVEGRRVSLIEELDNEITSLAMEIAEKIMLNEIEANPDAIVAVARKVIDRATERRGLKVRLSKQDYEVMRDREKDLMAGIVDVDEFSIVEDGTLARGDCVVETCSGVIDARLSARLNNVRDKLDRKDEKLDR